MDTLRPFVIQGLEGFLTFESFLAFLNAILLFKTLTVWQLRVDLESLQKVQLINAKSWFVIFNNEFCPQQNAQEFSDTLLKKKNIANPRIKNTALVNSYGTSRFLRGIATEEIKNLVSL